MAEARVARDVRIRGRVQGVGFRAWTAETARGLGLSGWVRNESDGSVRAHVAGPPDAVADMLDRMKRGPAFARVATLVERDTMPETTEGFELRR
jgi:acylphosphatase